MVTFRGRAQDPNTQLNMTGATEHKMCIPCYRMRAIDMSATASWATPLQQHRPTIWR